MSYCLNSIFQCLGNIHDLAIYNLKEKNYDFFFTNLKSMTLSFLFSKLIHYLYSSSKKKKESYSLKNIIIDLIKLNKNFIKINKRNPISLLKFILEELHLEYLLIDSRNLIENLEIKCDKFNKNDVINNAILNYDKNNKTFISQLFSWFEIEELQCSKCRKIYYQLQNNLTFDVNYFGDKNSFNIYDCLDNYYGNKEKKLICDFCNEITKIKSKKQIFSPPNYLIITLNFNDEYFTKKFLIDECIQIPNYINNDDSKIYFLIGIVSYVPNEQKFIAYYLSQAENIWYLCDNEIVTEINFDDILTQHNINFNNKAYILFYRVVQ